MNSDTLAAWVIALDRIESAVDDAMSADAAHADAACLEMHAAMRDLRTKIAEAWIAQLRKEDAA